MLRIALAFGLLCLLKANADSHSSTCKGSYALNGAIACTAESDVATKLACIDSVISDATTTCNAGSKCAIVQVDLERSNGTDETVISMSVCFDQTLDADFCVNNWFGEDDCVMSDIMFDQATCQVGNTAEFSADVNSVTYNFTAAVVECSNPDGGNEVVEYSCLSCDDTDDDCMPGTTATRADCPACWVKIVTNSSGDTISTNRGCRSDVTTDDFDCTSYEGGRCDDVTGGGEECLRCCESAACNTFTKSSVIAPTTTADASSMRASVFATFLFTFAYLFA